MEFPCKGNGVPARLGPGPVFVYEWLIATRRPQFYALRAGFVFALLAGMIFIWKTEVGSGGGAPENSRNEYALLGQYLYLTIVTIELAVVLLVAPGATAGAVCLDKARGTLDHMLITDLSNTEIVLGKLGVRLIPVLGLITCVLPVLALAGLLGGIDPDAAIGSFLTAIGCAVLGCSLALTLSVWGQKTRDVLIVTYFIIIVWLFCRYLSSVAWGAIGSSSLQYFLPTFAEWLDFLNPFFLVWAPYSTPGRVSMSSYLGFLAVCLFVSSSLAGLATWRIRAVAQARGGTRRSRTDRAWFAFPDPLRTVLSRLPGPSLDGNPVLWREWYRSKPSAMMRLVWFLYVALGVVWVLLSLQSIVNGTTIPDMIASMNVFQVGLGLLLLSVDAATSLVEERVRGSLDILLSTPLSTPSIVAGKWLGTFRRVPLLLFAPVLTTFFLACESGHWFAWVNLVTLLLAYSALIVSVGLALATWQSRLERAIALCVGFYVLVSIGWPALIIPMAISRMTEHLITPLIMGTPFFGTLFGTLVVGAGTPRIPGTAMGVWIGCYLWIAIDGAAAAGLYSVTLAVFDRCLGRMHETDDGYELSYREVAALPSGGRDFIRDWEEPFVATEARRN